MADSAPTQNRRPQDVLNAASLDAIRRFWFRHVAAEDHITVPDREALVWFSQNDEYDRECVATFGNILETIQSVDANVANILAAANPQNALDWMALIIILDQIPRNCYRGTAARIAYAFFDPLAYEVAMRAILAGIPEQAKVRYRQAYRFWFYMSLEHSEKLEVQDRLVQEHDRMFSDARRLMHGTGLGQDAEASDREKLLRREKEFDTWEDTLRGIAKQHGDTIVKHGRYPHRDAPLGRASANLAA